MIAFTGAAMRTLNRFAAFWLVLLTALLIGTAPANAASNTSEYRAELDKIALEMRALWGEMDRFTVQPRYCRPPFGPIKQPDEMLMAAYSARADELNARFNALKQSLNDFLAGNPRLYAELLVDGVDPRNDRWWSRWESSRKKMLQERNRKRDQLARAPVVDCTPKPKAKPAVQVPSAAPLPVRPQIGGLAWPEMPKQFCTWEEYWKFINEVINPRYVQAAENLEKAAKFRSEVEQQVNDYVQQSKPVPAALRALRRQAIADVAEQQRLSDEAERIRGAAKAIPVVDCGQQPRQTGMADFDFDRVEAQQIYIGEAEGLIARMAEARALGECDRADELYQELVGKLRWMDTIVVDAREKPPRRAFPPELIAELRRKARAAIEPCPPPGYKSRSQILNEARRAYRAAAQGDDPKAFEEAKERLLQVLDSEIAVETNEPVSDKLIRERYEVRSGELPREGILDEIDDARRAPPPPPRKIEEVHIPPKPVGTTGTTTPQQYPPSNPLPPGFRMYQELDGLRYALDSAIKACDVEEFGRAKNALIVALDRYMALEELTDQDKASLRARFSEMAAIQYPVPCPPRTAPAQPQARAVTAVQLNPRDAEFLNIHNQERRIFGSPPLKWDPALAQSAQNYANVMAQTGQLVHSPREGRGPARENLGRGLLGWSPAQLMGNWLKERAKFKPGVFPDVSTTGNWEDVSHYSQLVWPTTKNVGCGFADGRGFRWTVCHYTPGGNKDGVYISNGPSIAGPGITPGPTPRFDPRLSLPEKAGGGMQQIDPPAGTPPPPPPPPTASDPAPGGDEARHPLRDYFMGALDQHQKAWRAGDTNGQAEALSKMYYALQELLKRLRAARKAGPLSGVKPADVQRQIDELNELYRAANEQSRPRRPGEERG